MLEPHTPDYNEESSDVVVKKGREKKLVQKTKGTSTRHICDTCEKEFETKTLFIRHLESHTGMCFVNQSLNNN